MTVFYLGRTWTNYLLKQKQLNGDTIRPKQLACLKFVDCQLHPCILLAVRKTQSKMFLYSPKNPKYKKSSYSVELKPPFHASQN